MSLGKTGGIDSLDEGRVSFEEPADEVARALDPVCGVKVDRHDASTTSAVYRATVRYFCSPTCKTRFLEDPEAYV